MSLLTSYARDIAKFYHGDQRRKYTGESYVDSHCAEVAGAVVVHGQHLEIPQHAIAAAWLHDVLEDTPLTYTELFDLVPDRVARMVGWLTDVYTPKNRPDLNRSQRKKAEADRISCAPPMVRLIKLADVLSNTSTIVQYDPGFARTYLSEKAYLFPRIKAGSESLAALVRNSLLSGAQQIGIELDQTGWDE